MSLAQTKRKQHGDIASDVLCTRLNVESAYDLAHDVPVPASLTTSANGPVTNAFACAVAQKIKAAYYCMRGTTVAVVTTNYLRLELMRRTSDGASTSLVGYLCSTAGAFTDGCALAVNLVATNTACGLKETLQMVWIRSDVTTGVAASAGVLSVLAEETD